MARIRYPRITEKEWLGATSVEDLDLKRSTFGKHRKWRLFGCACVQRSLILLSDVRCEDALKATEDFADEVLSWPAVKTIRKSLYSIQTELMLMGESTQIGPIIIAIQATSHKTPIKALDSIRYALDAFASPGSTAPHWKKLRDREAVIQLMYAYDIFGNPFRPISFDSAWQTGTAVALAQTMYDVRDFVAMPILADALEDAGCEVPDILYHCRDPKGVHVRGCWVIDLVLGKS